MNRRKLYYNFSMSVIVDVIVEYTTALRANNAPVNKFIFCDKR